MAEDNDLELDSSSQEDLRDAIDRLTKAVQSLMDILKTASSDIHSEADNDIGKKLDILIKQNQDIAKALLLLLDVNSEHLPKISRQAERSHRRAYPVSPMQRIPVSMPPSQPAQNPSPAVFPAPNNQRGPNLLDLPDFPTNGRKTG